MGGGFLKLTTTLATTSMHLLVSFQLKQSKKTLYGSFLVVSRLWFCGRKVEDMLSLVKHLVTLPRSPPLDKHLLIHLVTGEVRDSLEFKEITLI